MTDERMIELAERLKRIEEMSLLNDIPVPCREGYTFLKRADLRDAAAALRSRAQTQPEEPNDHPTN